MAVLTRRGVAASLALVPLAGWGVSRALDFSGAVDLSAGGQAAGLREFHFPDDPTIPLWRALKALVPGRTALEGPVLSPSVVALDGQVVRLRGFMVPLEDVGAQRRFLFSANPPGCPGCVPLDPSTAVDVRGRAAMAREDGPMVLQGTLHLRRYEPLVYRLDGAERLG